MDGARAGRRGSAGGGHGWPACSPPLSCSRPCSFPRPPRAPPPPRCRSQWRRRPLGPGRRCAGTPSRPDGIVHAGAHCACQVADRLDPPEHAAPAAFSAVIHPIRTARALASFEAEPPRGRRGPDRTEAAVAAAPRADRDRRPASRSVHARVPCRSVPAAVLRSPSSGRGRPHRIRRLVPPRRSRRPRAAARSRPPPGPAGGAGAARPRGRRRLPGAGRGARPGARAGPAQRRGGPPGRAGRPASRPGSARTRRSGSTTRASPRRAPTGAEAPSRRAWACRSASRPPASGRRASRPRAAPWR